MPYIPTGAVQYAAYSQGLTQAAVGVALGNTLAAGYQTYELLRGEKQGAVQNIASVYGIGGTVFGATPIVGPFLQFAGLALGGVEALFDYTRKKRKANRIKRAIRRGESAFEEAMARGDSPELASFQAARSIGSRNLWSIDRDLYAALQSSPYSIANTLPSGIPRERLRQFAALGFNYRDPDTGNLITLEELRRKESGQFASEAAWQLATRTAPGQGMIPPVFARYTKAIQ